MLTIPDATDVVASGVAGSTGEPASTATITRGDLAASALIRRLLAAARHRVKFEAVPDQLVAELVGDDLLQFLDLLVTEFDDPAALQVDQVVVVVARHLLVARAAVAKIVAGENIGLLEQPH